MYVCMYVCLCMCMYVQFVAGEHMSLEKVGPVYVFPLYVYVCMYVCEYVCMYVCACRCVCA